MAQSQAGGVIKIGFIVIRIGADGCWPTSFHSRLGARFVRLKSNREKRKGGNSCWRRRSSSDVDSLDSFTLVSRTRVFVFLADSPDPRCLLRCSTRSNDAPNFSCYFLAFLLQISSQSGRLLPKKSTNFALSFLPKTHLL